MPFTGLVSSQSADQWSSSPAGTRGVSVLLLRGAALAGREDPGCSGRDGSGPGPAQVGRAAPMCRV